MDCDFMNTEERLAQWREEELQKGTNIGIFTIKLYLISVILNFLPVVVFFLMLGGNIHGDGAIGFYIYRIFFIISSIINLSFFLLNIKYVRNDEVMNFLAYYASSLFFLITTVCLSFLWGIGDFVNFIVVSIPFFTNFILAFIAKKIYKNEPKRVDFDANNEKNQTK